MLTKKAEKEKAIELRKEGKSLREITKTLGVSKGSVSLWVRNVILTKEQRAVLLGRTKNLFNIKRLKGTKTKRRLAMGEEAWENYQKEKKQKKIQKYKKIHNAIWWANKRKEIKQKLVDYKGGKCFSCGYSRCISALDFHHCNPDEKDFSISRDYRYNFEKLKQEVDKCILLCKNCHAELHFKLNEENRNPGMSEKIR